MKNLGVTTTRPCQSYSFVIRKTQHDGYLFNCWLVMTRDRSALKLMVNQGDTIRMVSFSDPQALIDAQGFLAIQDPAKVATQVVSSVQTQEIDDELFFGNVFKNLFMLKNAGILDQAGYAEHAAMVEQYHDACDSESLIAYLKDQYLADVVDDSLVYRTSTEEIVFWKSIWRTVVSKAAILDKR